MIRNLAQKLDHDVQVLGECELNDVTGGFYNDNGCIPVITLGPGGHVFQAPYNPWLTWGSPERGGK